MIFKVKRADMIKEKKNSFFMINQIIYFAICIFKKISRSAFKILDIEKKIEV